MNLSISLGAYAAVAAFQNYATIGVRLWNKIILHRKVFRRDVELNHKLSSWRFPALPLPLCSTYAYKPCLHERCVCSLQVVLAGSCSWNSDNCDRISLDEVRGSAGIDLKSTRPSRVPSSLLDSMTWTA